MMNPVDGYAFNLAIPAATAFSTSGGRDQVVAESKL
jgi:hypothetical protein